MAYRSPAEIARLIRADLKAKFGSYGARFFSVRASSGSVNVSWTDGPTTAQVDALIKGYAAISRDEAGEILSGGNLFVFSYREHSERVKTYARAEVRRTWDAGATDQEIERDWNLHRQYCGILSRIEVRPDGQILAWSEAAARRFESRTSEERAEGKSENAAVLPFRRVSP